MDYSHKSLLALILFNILYTNHLGMKHFVYADYLAITNTGNSFEKVEEIE